MEYLPLVFIALFIAWMVWLAQRASKDLDYCIRHSIRQRQDREDRLAEMEAKIAELQREERP